MKSRIFLLGTLGYILALCLFNPIQSASFFYAVPSTFLTTQAFSFLYFMVISYEYFYQIKACKLEEIVCISKMGLVKEKLLSSLIFIALDFGVCLAFWISSVLVSGVKFDVWNRDWFLLLAQTVMIYHFLTYLFAILLGFIVSFIYVRIRAFAVLMGIYALFSKIFLPTVLGCAAHSEHMTHVLDIFGIMNRNYYYGADLYSMYSVESANVQRILFWILLSVFLIFVIINKQKRIVVSVALFASACVMFVLYAQPAGYRYNGGYWGTGDGDSQYYMLLYEDDTERIARTYKEADFKVSKYEGNLSAKRVLNVSIDVTVEQSNLKKYCFTLYHGYKIKKVQDEKGTPLTYIQDGDHVLVKNESAKPIQKIHFEYTGFSKVQMATSQAVFLAGNFPYLPKPGWQEYMSEPEGNMWNIEYNLKNLNYKVEYDFWFYTKNKVYSNLTEIEPSHFVGTSEAASFMASKFIRETKIKNMTLYYSNLAATYKPTNIEKTKKELEVALKDVLADDTKKEMKVFDLTVMASGMNVYCFASDHLVAGESEITDFYPYYRKTGEIPNMSDVLE